MLDLVIRVLITLNLLCSSSITIEINKSDIQNDNIKDHNKRAPNYFNRIPEDPEINQYFKYKLLQSISPFDTSDLELKPLGVDPDSNLYIKYLENEVNSKNENNIVNNKTYNQPDDLSTNYNVTEINGTRNISDINNALLSSNKNYSKFQTDIDLQQTSDAHAYLSVNNITIENFYENRSNIIIAPQFRNKTDDLFQNKKKSLGGIAKHNDSDQNGNVAEHFQENIASTEISIKNLDDFIYYATEHLEDYSSISTESISKVNTSKNLALKSSDDVDSQLYEIHSDPSQTNDSSLLGSNINNHDNGNDNSNINEDNGIQNKIQPENADNHLESKFVFNTTTSTEVGFETITEQNLNTGDIYFSNEHVPTVKESIKTNGEISTTSIRTNNSKVLIDEENDLVKLDNTPNVSINNLEAGKATTKIVSFNDINVQDITIQYADNKPSEENYELRQDAQSYDKGDNLNDLRNDLHASLDDITQRLIWKTSYMHARTSAGYIEELNIVNITVNGNFEFGEGIKHWKNLNLWGKNYIVGIGRAELLLIQSNLNNDYITYKISHAISTEKDASSLDIIRFRFENKVQSFTVVSVKNQIIWFIISPEEQLIEIWRWFLHASIKFVQFIKIENADYLFTIENFDNTSFAGHLYEFSIERKEFWLKERIVLECETNVASISYVANNVFLAIPQETNNLVIVYKFVDGRFIPFYNIESTQVNFVSSFSVGHKNFLAVGGYDHAIYRVDINGFHKEAILDSTFDNVQFYLPVHIRNYREDLIVLVQHEIDYDSHSSIHVEALIWTERGFITSQHEICDYHNEISYGFQCLLDDETETGLIGSAIINHGKQLNIIIPRSSLHSEAYEITTSLIQASDPRQAELNQLYKIRDTLEVNFKHQLQVLIDSKNALENSLSGNADVLVKTRWHVNEIETPIYREESKDMIWIDGFLKMSNVKFTRDDTTIHIPTLVELSDRILASVLDLPFLMKDAVKIRDTNIKLAENLTINGDLRIEGGWKAESLCLSDINGDSFNDLFHRLMYDKQTVKYNGAIQFDKVYVDNLFVDYLNDYPVSNILFKSPETVVQGNLNFIEDTHFDRVYIKSEGTISEINYNELLRTDSKINYLALDMVNILRDFKVRKINKFVIDEKELSDATNTRQQRNINDVKEINVLGDISFETINGMNWKKFIPKVVWKNSPKVLKNSMIIEGDIKCSEPCLLHLPNINDLSFPTDLIFFGIPNENNNDLDNRMLTRQYVIVPNSKDNYDSVSPRGTILESYLITGQKTFVQLNVKNLDCPGLINDISTDEVIILQGDQTVKGLITFENLKVTEGLHIDGSLTGKYLDNFTANPTIKDSYVIHSNVIFKHLEVHGPIYVQNLNGSNLVDVLNDVIYTNEDDVIINGYKIFENSLIINENFELSSNRINGIDTDYIMTTNTEQLSSLNNINGDINFIDLTLVGVIDDVNVTDLYINSMKLYGDQYISSDITFSGQANFVYLNINNLFGKSVDDIITIDKPVHLSSSAEFEKIVIENLFVDRLFIENDIFCGFNLQEMQEKCFSLVKPQYITADYEVAVINAINARSSKVDILHSEINLRKRRNITQMLTFDNEPIYELIIDGNITTGKINGYRFKEIIENAVWLNKENYVAGNLHFLEGFKASEIQSKGLVNGYDFNTFVEHLVLADENIYIHGPKTFTLDLNADTIYTNKINSVEIFNILTKNSEQTIGADFIINGDVVMDEAECTKYFNGLSIEEIQNHYSYKDEYHIVNGDVIFSKPAFIENLILDKLNDVNLQELLSRLVLTNDQTIFTSSLNFENDVIFGNQITVSGSYNRIDLNQFANDLVFVDRNVEIACPVVFEENVVFAGDLKFEGDVTAATVSGFETEFWIENRISIKDGATVSGNKKFLNIVSPEYGWTARTLNNHDLSTIFTLNTDQVVPQNVYFFNVVIQEACDLESYLNGKILLEETANTLMVMSEHEQVIEAATSFEYVHVRDSLEIKAQINAKYNVQNAFTLDSDQIIYTPGHVFETILTPFSDINGTVSGVDFNKWTTNVLRRSANDQIISGHWYIDTVEFQNNIIGNNILNDRDMHNLADEIAKQKLLLDMREKELKDEYTSFCLDIRYLLNLSKRYLYLLKYFEETQFILYDNVISMHIYEDNFNHYLIINNGECKSTIYKWNSEQKSFNHAYLLETGIVDGWINVQNNDGSKFIISNSNKMSKCNIVGANVWYVADATIKHVFILGQGIREILASTDGVFYTIESTGVKEYALKGFGSELEVTGIWNMYTDESTFVPHEAGFDLSLSDGKRVTKLSKTKHSLDKSAYEIFGSEPVIAKSLATNEISTTECPYLPKSGNGEVVVLTVGLGSSLRQMVAVSVLENATVGGNYDFIKIYDDVMEGRLFQTLPCLRPSNLVSINFGQGQTILAFIEDKSHIKIYDYRGIEGFIHLHTFKFSVSKLSTVVLPVNKYSSSSRHFLLAGGYEGLRVLEALMHGDRIQFKEELLCKP